MAAARGLDLDPVLRLAAARIRRVGALRDDALELELVGDLEEICRALYGYPDFPGQQYSKEPA